MGFKYWSDEQRVRINLSESALSTIADDMYQFKIKDRSTFMNMVFKNFYADAKSSVNIYLSNRKKQLLDTIEFNSKTKEAYKNFINQII